MSSKNHLYAYGVPVNDKMFTNIEKVKILDVSSEGVYTMFWSNSPSDTRVVLLRLIPVVVIILSDGVGEPKYLFISMFSGSHHAYYRDELTW